MKTISILLIGAFIFLFSCKPQSQAMGAEKIESSSTNNKKNETGVYDIIVSFASMGAGIKRDIRKKLDDAITSFNQDNNVTINVEKYGWGREGEVDYLFNLENLSTKQKKALKAKVKAVIGDSELIFISYDTKSVHKR